MGFSKYKRGRVWWCKFYDPETGLSYPFSLNVKDSTAADFKISEMEKLWALGQFNPAADAVILPLKKAVQKFLKAKEVDGARVGTVDQYFYTLQHLEKACKAGISLNAVTPTDINNLLSKFANAATKRKNYRHARHFFNYVTKVGWLKKNPFTSVPIPPATKKKPKAPTLTQYDAFIAVIDRDWFLDLVEIIALYGLRRNEALFLKDYTIDFEQEEFTVSEHEEFSPKTHQERTLPLLDKAQEIFERRIHLSRCDGYLFTNEEGRRLTPNWITQMFIEYRKRAGIPKGYITIHSLRHLAGAILARNNVPLPVIAQILGHAQYSTTEIYTQLNVEHLKAPLKNIQNAIKK